MKIIYSIFAKKKKIEEKTSILSEGFIASNLQE